MTSAAASSNGSNDHCHEKFAARAIKDDSYPVLAADSVLCLP